MKKILVVFVLFAALVFVVSCGGGSKTGDTTDTGETVTDGDTADSGSSDTDPSDSGHENPDTTPEQPDNGDSQPDDGDTTPDGGDSQPDDGDTEPDNDYPQTPCDPNPCLSDANSTGVCTINNHSYVCGCIDGYIFDGTLCIKSLPECSPESDTPCIDSATGLIWSAKSESKMPWNDALNYCQNLTEGDFSDWRLPSIAVLRTLVQNCSSEKCAEDYTGKYSKFGDTVYLWSSSEGAESTAKSIYFSDAGTQSVSTDTNVNVRCVRRETESRQVNCTGLIENSVWNTATQITQTWNWDWGWGWTPSSIARYNTDASTSECRFKCDSNSFRDDGECVNPCKPNLCNSIGETGTCVGISANEYTCECKENYFWDGSSHCFNPCEPNPCTSIGEPGICIGKSANEYQCECENNYFWDSSSNKCIKNPCQNNPCSIPNSTGTCVPVTKTQYTCECEENYYWDGSQCVKPATLCNPNPCTGIANSTGNCTVNGTSYVCGCQSSYDWNGTQCTSGGYSVGDVVTFGAYEQDNNTNNGKETIEWKILAVNGNIALLLADKGLSTHFFSGKYNYSCAWRDSDIRSWLRGDFYNEAFNSTEKSVIASSAIKTESNYNIPTITTTDKIFLLSQSEVTQYFPTPCDRLVYPTAYAKANGGTTEAQPDCSGDSHRFGSWWLRSPGDNYCQAMVVSSNGHIYSTDTMMTHVVVRPALWMRFRDEPVCSSTSSTPCKDLTSGLVWSARASSTMTWSNAISYCDNLTEGGYTDWQLPTISQLRTLIQNCSKTETDGTCGVTDSRLNSSFWTESACYSCSYDVSGGYSKFGETGWFWSSSTLSDNTDYAWLVHFDYGGVDSLNKDYGLNVRCVQQQPSFL